MAAHDLTSNVLAAADRPRVALAMSTLEASSPRASDARSAILLRASRRALREPAVLLSLAYIAMSALGLWASYWLYRPFGIPIFEYMQPSDILVAGWRDPAYLLLVAAGFALSMLSRWWQSWRFDHPERAERLRGHWLGRMWAPHWRERLNSSPLGRTLFAVAFVVYLAFFLVFAYTRSEAARLVRGEGQRVALVYAGAAEPMAEPAILIGTTAGWVFVYWPQHRAEAIAQQSLRSLAYPAIAAPPGCPETKEPAFRRVPLTLYGAQERTRTSTGRPAST
jgi:hypothetical protein